MAEAALARVRRGVTAFGKPGDERTCECRALAWPQRMRVHAWRLVERDEVAILIKHVERQLWRWHEHGFRGRTVAQVHPVASNEAMPLLGDVAIDPYGAAGHRSAGRRRAGHQRAAGQEGVESRPRLARCHDEQV